MHSFIRGCVGVAVLLVALPMLAATPSEFYVAMLRKGIAAHDAGRFEMAVSPLRVAAFGTVESVEHYQTAHVYLALTYDRLGNADQARDSARRVLAAQRLETRYSALQLPAAVRTAFDALVRRLLTAADAAALARPATSSAATPQGTTPPATATTTPPVTQPPVQTTTAVQNPPAQPTTTTTTTPAQNVPVQSRPQPQPQPVDPTPVPPRDTRPESPATQAGTNSSPVTTTTQPPPAATTTAPVSTTPVNKPESVTTPTTTKPESVTTTTTKPASKPAPPATTTKEPATKPVTRPAPIDVPGRFAAAERALNAANLLEARAIYRELLDGASLQRADLLRLAEGFYRARDFANALRAFDRVGPLRPAEQPYRYYVAVALYETGQYAKAKAELAAVLPYIEETSDVTRYRAKIENAIN